MGRQWFGHALSGIWLDLIANPPSCVCFSRGDTRLVHWAPLVFDRFVTGGVPRAQPREFSMPLDRHVGDEVGVSAHRCFGARYGLDQSK